MKSKPQKIKWSKSCGICTHGGIGFISAMMVVFQVFEYRHDYRELSSYMRERDDLNAEWGRLLIEQQTFGATAQIGTRAVTQLRMFSPPAAETVVISLPMTSEQNK